MVMIRPCSICGILIPGVDKACGVRVEEFIFLYTDVTLYIEVVESVSYVLINFLLHDKTKQARMSLPSCALYVGTRSVQNIQTK